MVAPGDSGGADMTELGWQRLLRFEAFEPASPVVFDVEGRSVVLFQSPGDELRCVENVCPLDGVATPRHIAKHCLADCDCASRAGVESELPMRFPVRVREGWVEIGLLQESEGQRRLRLGAALEAALLAGRMEDALRAAARLLGSGGTPARLVDLVLRFDARFGEQGSTDVSSMAIDALRFSHQWSGPDFCVPFAHVLEASIQRHARSEPRGMTALLVDPPGQGFRKRLLALAESGEQQEAEALLRAAFVEGLGLRVIEEALLTLCAEHFLDEGRGLRATIAVLEFLGRHGSAEPELLLVALLRRLMCAERSDQGASWRGFRQRVESLPEGPDPLVALEDRRQGARLRDRVLGSRPKDAFDAVAQTWQRGQPPGLLAGALVSAAAHRVLRFDEKHERDWRVHEGWAAVTQRLVHACSVLHAVERVEGRPALLLLLQCAHFVHTGRALDTGPDRGLVEPRPERPATGETSESFAQRLDESIRRRDAQAALRVGAAWLAAGAEPFELRALLAERLLSDVDLSSEQLAIALHLLLASMDLLAWYGEDSPGRESVLAALRFASTATRGRPLRRLTHEALRFVQERSLPQCRT